MRWRFVGAGEVGDGRYVAMAVGWPPRLPPPPTIAKGQGRPSWAGPCTINGGPKCIGDFSSYSVSLFPLLFSILDTIFYLFEALNDFSKI